MAKVPVVSKDVQADPPCEHSSSSNRVRSSRGESNEHSRGQHRTSSARRRSSSRRQQHGLREEISASINPGQPRFKAESKRNANAMDKSELSLSLEDLQIFQRQSKHVNGDNGDTDMETRRRRRNSSKKRSSSHHRPSNPEDERRRSKSMGRSPVLQGSEKSRSHSQGQCHYNGVMVTMVEQMHGSGSTLDYQDSLRISRHSRKRYSEIVLQKRKPTNQQDARGIHHGDDFHASCASSSLSSFAVTSQHEWTGWSSSSSADPNRETSSSDVLRGLNHAPNATKDTDGSRTLKKQKPKQEEKLATSTAPSIVPGKDRSIVLSNSSHSTPVTRRRKLSAHDIERMYSSAPCKIGPQKVRDRSVLRLKELIASYEGAKADDTTNRPTEALPIIHRLEDFSSPRRTPKRHVGKADSGDTTVRQTNRSHDLVDPEEETEKHANISYEKKRRKDKHLPTPTSKVGYYSPWRAATVRRMSALADGASKCTTARRKESPRRVPPEQSTPRTHPLTDTPRMKRKVKTNLTLSEISPLPLLSPPTRPRIEKREQKSPGTSTGLRNPIDDMH
jgi:hypothetical protein